MTAAHDLAGVGEAVLRAAEHASLGLGIVTLDAAGPRTVFMNQALLTVLGRTRDEVLERSLIDFIAPEAREAAAAVVRERLQGGTPLKRLETVILRPDGTRVPIVSFTGELEIDGKPASVHFVLDATQRLEAERARLAEAQRLARVVESAPDGIAVVRGPIILSINPAGARMLGLDGAKTAVGVSLADLMLPEEVPMMMRRMKAAAEGAGQGSQVYRVRRKDGSIISAEVSSIPFEHDGKPALLAFVRDVTERAHLQEQMARAERLASLSTLAAGLAHEVNNPLTAAMLQLDVVEQSLVSEFGGAAPPALAQRLDDLRKTHERIAEVMRDFAAFARTGDEKRERVDLREILCAVVRMLSPMLSKKSTFHSSIETLPAVLADASRLEQVFVNLLLNAVQALPEGRQGNSIELKGRVVPDGRVCVEVVDNGMGISTENLRRVFDPFFTTKPVGVGTGLGLTVCHNIVSSYGGVIEIDSVSGHGCTIRVLLPAAQTQPGLSLQPGRTRVMIIDDEPHLANTLRLLLEDRHEVVAMTSSDHAVRVLIGGAPIDVVVCDVMMPDPNGPEVYRRVTAARPELKDRFIFMSGGVYTGATEMFLDSTSAPRVTKPFDPAQLERLIAKVAGSTTPGA